MNLLIDTIAIIIEYKMKISTNTAAVVSYRILMNNSNGELIEFADEKSPRLLIFGNNSIIPGFETQTHPGSP